jgi:dihydroorotate dehydrogenase
MRRVLTAWGGRTDLSRFHLIASGGVSDADDAYERITLGASLVQLYTGLIYRGPRLVGELLRGLARRVRQDGFRTIGEAVGTRRPSI